MNAPTNQSSEDNEVHHKAAVRKILEMLKTHFQEIHDPLMLGLWVLGLTVAISVNYSLNFADQILNAGYGKWFQPFAYFAFYGTAFYGTIGLLIATKRIPSPSSKFWAVSVVMLALLALNGSFYLHEKLSASFELVDERYFSKKLMVNFRGVIVFGPFLLLLRKWWWTTEGPKRYGLVWPKSGVRAYLIMVLCMLPLLIAASFLPDFLKTYPRWRPWQYDAVFGLEKWQMTALYELSYAVDFVMVELVFRGLLVIGLAKWLGPHSVLPMVSTYAFLHFGKPLGETLGSIPGGYILGVLALRTNSIVSGIIAHWGIAFGMEGSAVSQHIRIGTPGAGL